MWLTLRPSALAYALAESAHERSTKEYNMCTRSTQEYDNFQEYSDTQKEYFSPKGVRLATLITRIDVMQYFDEYFRSFALVKFK